MHYHSLAKVKSPCPSEGLRPVSCYPSLQMNKCFTQPYQRCTVGTSVSLQYMGLSKNKNKNRSAIKSITFLVLAALIQDHCPFISFILLKTRPSKNIITIIIIIPLPSLFVFSRTQDAFYISEHLLLCRLREHIYLNALGQQH